MEKFTIIIPTKDRSDTLKYTLQTCLNQSYENLEIIVSDNSSGPDSFCVVSSIQDSRLRYFRTSTPLSMSDSFEFALSHVDSGFVIFLGDDDGIYPNAVNRAAKIAKRFNVQAVSGKYSTYIWPNFPDDQICDAAWLGFFRTKIEIRKSAVWINNALNFKSKYCFDLPSVYYGFVHIDVIKNSYKNGRYFNSITPDAYSAFATAMTIPVYAYSHIPLVIAGSSARSNGASQMSEKVDTKEADDYVAKSSIALASGFTYCPTFEAILYEAFCKYKQLFPDRASGYSEDRLRMLQISLGETNLKTRDQVSVAVQKMAVAFSFSEKDLFPVKFPLRRMQFRKFPSLFLALISGRSYAIRNASLLGINNVYDASLAMHVLINKSKFSFFKIFIKKVFRI